jgi:ATP-dependent RNA helicase DDX60
VVEYFLENLQRRGCKFHIVFFADHEQLCVPYFKAPEHKYFLARSIIIKHLTQSTPEKNVEVHLFDTLKDPEFRQYVNESGAYFVACCDGAKIKSARKRCRTRNREYLRGMIHHFMSNFGLDVALVNGLEWRDSKIMTFVLERKRMQGTEDKNIEAIFKNYHQDLIKDNCHSRRNVLEPSEVQSIVDDLRKCEGVNDRITLRLIITMIFLKEFQTPSHATYCSALLLHVLLLGEMPLSSRRQPKIQLDQVVEVSVRIFVQEYCTYCRNLIEQLDWSITDASDIVDLFDGRLFRNVVFAISEGPDLIKDLSEKLKCSYMSLQRYLAKQTPTRSLTLCTPSVAMTSDENSDGTLPEDSDSEQCDDEIPDQELSNEEYLKKEVASQVGEPSVLPFSHPIFNKHLASISITVKDRELNNGSNGKIFRELTHWHNSRNPLVPKRGRAIDPVEKARANKKNQRFMAEMTAYAASLTNASGKVLTPETIISRTAKENRTVPLPANHDAAKKPAKQVKGKKSGKAIVQAQIAQGQAKQEKKDIVAALLAWKRWVAETLEAIPDLRSRYLRAIAYYDDKTGQKGIDAIIPELDLYKLSTLVQIWASYCRASKKDDGYHIAALMLVLMEQLARSEIECPAETSLILKKMAMRIGFVLPPMDLQEGPPLTFAFAFQKSAPLELDMEPRDFSLLHVGPYFDRDIDSQDDHRVQFRPDGWQVKVLDLLDKKSSLLVVAPTSSGKTFISFYA